MIKNYHFLLTAKLNVYFLRVTIIISHLLKPILDMAFKKIDEDQKLDLFEIDRIAQWLYED
ncbi:hypothetical protein A7P53_14590 [Acinetobacter defluvii]|nr:hypothetical protein [Acinetobacter defluvii]